MLLLILSVYAFNMFASFVSQGVFGINRSSHWKCSDWNGFPQNSCSIILPAESIGKILGKCLRKSSFLSKTAGYSLQHCQKWSFSQVFLSDFDQKLRIPMWISVAVSEFRRFLICLLGNFIAIIKLLNSLSKERCFYGNKYLGMYRDLWQRRYYPLVKLCII